MDTSLLKNLTITKARELLDSKAITVRELVEYYRKNIAEKNPDINAYIETFDDAEIDADILRAQTMIDRGEQKALTGIPYALKDNILYKGRKASACAGILQGYVASYDADVIVRIKEHAAIVLGRVNMDDAAMGSSTETSYFGITKNPLDTSRVPGGSSGGPAAALAMDGAVFSLASDTGGSIRQPSSYCGLVGLCPTYGTVSRSGLISLASSLDVIGPIARSVEDARIVYNVIANTDPLDATAVSVADHENNTPAPVVKKIGVPRAFINTDGIDPTVKARFEESLELLKKNGYEIVDIELKYTPLSLATYYIILPAEASANLARYDGVRYGFQEKGENLLATYSKTRGKGFGKEVRRRILLGTYVLSAGYRDAYYGQATRLRNRIKKEMSDIFETVDVILTPTATTEAFKFGEKTDPVAMYMSDFFIVPANIANIPGISVPMGVGASGMPIGLHMFGPRLAEERLLTLAEHFEKLSE